MLDAHARRMQRCAVYYAELGFCVFPCARGTKFPCKDTHGELSASDDPAFVREVWEAFPGANIGWALRYAPGVFVLDVDERSGGHHWLAHRPQLPRTVKTLTPRRGNNGHYWFAATPALQSVVTKGLKDTSGQVDIKGLPKGYVLLPPSTKRGSEHCYEFEVSPREAEIADCPEWLESEIFFAKRVEREEWDMRRRAMPVGTRAQRDTLVHIFRARGDLGPQIRPGVWAVRCPNESQHSEKRRRFAGDTVLFEPPPGGRGPGWLYCAHAHCQDIMKELTA